MNFDEAAKTWDSEKRIVRAKKIALEIEKSLDGIQAGTAMEFGCGTGLISFNLCKRFDTTTLLDSSAGMIEVVNEKIMQCKAAMEALCIDLLNDDTYAKKFDVIYHSMVLHHIHDTASAIHRFHDLLNKDGCLCIVDLDEEDGSFHKEYPDFDGHNGFHQEKLKDILRSTGFDDVRSHTFYHDEKEFDGVLINYSLFIMTGRKCNGVKYD